MRSVKLACGAILLVGLLAAVAAAQGPRPDGGGHAGEGVVHHNRPDRSRPGPRFEFTRTGSGDVEAYLATLRAGVTLDELRRSRRPRPPWDRLSRGQRVAVQRRAQGALTVDLRPNVSYV